MPTQERKVVFGGLDSLFSFHKESFLPALEMAAASVMLPPSDMKEWDADGEKSKVAAKDVASVFVKHAAFMRMYSTYIKYVANPVGFEHRIDDITSNFDNSVMRVKYWSSSSGTLTPSSSTAQLVGLGLSMSAVSNPGALQEAVGNNLSASQRKRMKAYLKRCRMNPRHSQLNLEGYLLLPVQRIPRYKLLVCCFYNTFSSSVHQWYLLQLEELMRSTPPVYDYIEDSLDKAVADITSLASNMNESKRDAESRRKLVRWQARIRGRFPSPLVQPHRRLIMDGPLKLTRVVRKTTVSFEIFNAMGEASTVQVDCLSPELTPRSLVGILCNDFLVLCRDPSDGHDPNGYVDLWAVLRMQTLPQPASVVHGNALRLVDNKAILYFDAPSPSDALNWFRAINLHIPTIKS